MQGTSVKAIASSPVVLAFSYFHYSFVTGSRQEMKNNLREKPWHMSNNTRVLYYGNSVFVCSVFWFPVQWKLFTYERVPYVLVSMVASNERFDLYK